MEANEAGRDEGRGEASGGMRVAYVGGRYRAPTVRGIVENIRRAEEVALELWKLGFAVICPHKNSALFDGACDDSVWLAGSLELMRRSDIVVLVPGWEYSTGTLAEIQEAAFIMPIYKWPGDLELIRACLEEDST